MAPAATLATVGDRWADRCRGRTIPVTPAHSALRSTRPQVVGVGDAVQDQQEREPAPLGRLAQVLERRVLGSAWPAPRPPGTRRSGPRRRSACRDTYSTLTRRLAASASMSSRISAASIPSAISSVGHRTSAGAQQLADGLAALDLVAPEPFVLRAPADRAVPAARAPSPVVDRRPTGARAARRRHPGPRRARPWRPWPSSTPPWPRCPSGTGPPRAPPFLAGVRDALPRPPARWRWTHRPPRPRRRRTRRPVPARRPAAPPRCRRSPRPGPAHPRPSARVALTLTGAPSAAASRSAMPGTCGRQPGSLGHHRAVGVDRRPSRPPAASATTRRRMSRESAPAHRGVGVRHVPAEVAEPRRPRARRRRWRGHTASASLWPSRPAHPVAGDHHAPEHQRPVRVVAEGVDVDPLAHPQRRHRRSDPRSPGRPGQQRLGQGEVLGPGQLEVAGVPGHGPDRPGRPPRAARRRRWPRRRRRGRPAARRRRRPAGSGRPPGRPGRRWRPPGRRPPASACRPPGTTGTAPSTSPARTASTTAANSAGAASGRAASWTTITAASAGTAARPARTESARVAPPADHQVGPAGRVAGGARRRQRVRSVAGVTVRDHQDHAVGRRAGRRAPTRTATGEPGQGEELLAAAEPATRAAGDHDGPDGPRSAQGSASLRRTSAVSSSTPRAKVSSDTRIWRARLSMRFSPADSPLSLSRMERFRTTSATW